MVIKSLIIFWLKKKIFSFFLFFTSFLSENNIVLGPKWKKKNKTKNVSHSVKLSVLDNGHYHMVFLFKHYFQWFFFCHIHHSWNDEWKRMKKWKKREWKWWWWSTLSTKKNLFNSRSSSNVISFLSCILSCDQYWKIWKFFLFNTHTVVPVKWNIVFRVVQQQQKILNLKWKRSIDWNHC